MVKEKILICVCNSWAMDVTIVIELQSSSTEVEMEYGDRRG